MKSLAPARAAAAAVSNREGHPATALLHDSPDARIVVFRIGPGQAVPRHQNASSVIMCVIQGSGFVQGPDSELPVSAGDIVAYDPNEQHGMRADTETLVIAATIAPRPGTRSA